MDLGKIGAILKQTIKDRDFTQEEFAEITGIGLSSLKKYMSGKVSYSIEVLEIIADRLQCSYDYLLGKSFTPERELQDVKEATRLSDGALEKIKSYAKDYDDDSESRRYLNTLSTLVQSNFLLERIVDFFYIDTEADGITTPEEQDTPESSKDGIYAKTYANVLPQPSIFIGHETLTPPDIEDAYLLGIVRALYASKKIVNENIPATLRNYRTKQKDAE